jgi:hypothetical protein
MNAVLRWVGGEVLGDCFCLAVPPRLAFLPPAIVDGVGGKVFWVCVGDKKQSVSVNEGEKWERKLKSWFSPVAFIVPSSRVSQAATARGPVTWHRMGGSIQRAFVYCTKYLLIAY